MCVFLLVDEDLLEISNNYQTNSNNIKYFTKNKTFKTDTFVLVFMFFCSHEDPRL